MQNLNDFIEARIKDFMTIDIAPDSVEEVAASHLRSFAQTIAREVTERFNEYAGKERDKILETAGVDNFNKLDNAELENYWLAMNSMMIFADSLIASLETDGQ